MSYDLVFEVDFETNIRGHHVYKSVWTPILGEQLKCMKDNREEAKDHDENATGVPAMGLVVPARFKCMTKKKTFAKILHKELN